MEKDILTEFEKEMKARRLKIPAIAKKLKIPKDRIYKWYQQGTVPKVEDAVKIWDWINGETSNIVGEPEVKYEIKSTTAKYIELLEKSLEEKDQRIRELEENSGKDMPIRKKASA